MLAPKRGRCKEGPEHVGGWIIPSSTVPDRLDPHWPRPLHIARPPGLSPTALPRGRMWWLPEVRGSWQVSRNLVKSEGEKGAAAFREEPCTPTRTSPQRRRGTDLRGVRRSQHLAGGLYQRVLSEGAVSWTRDKVGYLRAEQRVAEGEHRPL